MSLGEELTGRTAADLAELVRAGDVSAVEVTDAHLERTLALDGEVRSFLCVAGPPPPRSTPLGPGATRSARWPASRWR